MLVYFNRKMTVKQIIKYRKRKIILIVDNLRVHHSRLVKEWVEQNKHRIELYYLPAYCPEMNPDEYLNNDLKQNVTMQEVPRNKEDLDAIVWVKMFLLCKLFKNHLLDRG